MKRFLVQTGRPYEALVGEGILAALGEQVAGLSGKRYRRAVLVSDDRVFALYGETACASLRQAGLEVAAFSFPHGEASKSMETVCRMLDAFSSHYLTRSDVVVALGGGVTGDMAGFAAAIYQRGVDYVQVPTTLLAAVDSSVGGKTAVNLPAGKNLAGAFWQPVLVLCDIKTLDTLTGDIFSEGLAEAVKHGCIRDPELFELLETEDPRAVADKIILRSVALKSAVVAEDEREHGLRQILNFGHTLGHGIEKLSHYSLSHGKAVAVGMSLAADACAANDLLSKQDAGRIRAVLKRCGLPTECDFSIEDICAASLGDKKRHGNSMHLITLEAIGRAAIRPIPVDNLLEFFTRA